MPAGARIKTAIEVLDRIEAAPARHEGPADRVLNAYFRARRWIGAKDRRVIAETVFAVLRNRAALDCACTDRNRPRVLTQLLLDGWPLADALNGGRYCPDPIASRATARSRRPRGARRSSAFSSTCLAADRAHRAAAPTAKWRLTHDMLERCRALQTSTLDRVAPWLAEGGRLFNATCSVLPCENERQIAVFLARRPGFRLVPIESIWRRCIAAAPPTMSAMLQPAPLRHATDGFFIAVLERQR